MQPHALEIGTECRLEPGPADRVQGLARVGSAGVLGSQLAALVLADTEPSRGCDGGGVGFILLLRHHRGVTAAAGWPLSRQ
jgi:hypothetical protein